MLPVMGHALLRQLSTMAAIKVSFNCPVGVLSFIKPNNSPFELDYERTRV